jgi:Rrf2 family protein
LTALQLLPNWQHMSANSRLAVATHLLTVLAYADRKPSPCGPVSSETLAHSVNTNPIVVRKLLGSLREAGLVICHAGRHGGATLARPPEKITLFDVWRAVDEPNVFGFSRHPPDARCPVGSCVNALLADVFEGVETSLGDELRKTRISDLLADVVRTGKKRRA